MKMYDGDFTFSETENVQTVLDRFDAGEVDNSALERLVDAWAVEPDQMIVD